jgi:hypothetical protein
MLIIRIELWPFGDEDRKKEIARMRIYNDGFGNLNYGHYVGEIWYGDSTKELDYAQANNNVKKQSIVKNWPRELHVWNLVQQMLSNMNYGILGPKGWK